MSNPIAYTTTGDPVLQIMDRSLREQARKACVKRTFINTLRCVEREPPQFGSKKQALVFAWGELLQNPADHMKDALADVRCTSKVNDGGNRIDWLLLDFPVLAVAATTGGIDIVQVGLPLSLNCIGTGTAQKTAGGEANSDGDTGELDASARQSGNSEAGGFGDGSKTAFVSLLYYGYDCRYIFLFYDSTAPSMVLEWHWKVGTFGDFTEKHMAVQLQFRKATDEEMELPKRPTMITRVTRTDSAEDSDILVRSFVDALCRFQSLMYTTQSNKSEFECIYAKGFGAWQHSSVYVPKVDCFMGYKIAVPTKSGRSLVLVSGIFYFYFDYRAPRNLVIIVVGKGIPGSEFQVFNNQLREINEANLKSVWAVQYQAFHAAKHNRDALTAGFMPLLRRCSSHLIDRQPHSLINNMLLDTAVCDSIRKLLLFRKLSPSQWGPNEAAKKREVAKCVEQAVLVTDYNYDKALYYQFLCGRSNNVVKIDHYVANAMVFRPTQIDEMEKEASNLVLKDAKSRSPKISEMIGSEFRKAVAYICGKERSVNVVRVVEDPGEGIVPINFRYLDIVVLYQPVLNCEHLVNILQPQLRQTADEASRAMQFVLHFLGNEARSMAVSKRVAYAIKQATEKMPYDLGESSRGQKRAVSDDDSDDDSDDSDHEALTKMLNKKHKPPMLPSGGEKHKVSPQNAARINAPPDNMRTLPKGIAGVGRDGSHPVRDVDDTESCKLTWNDNHSLFLPDDKSMSMPAELTKTVAIFNRCVDLVRANVNVGTYQIYAAFAPSELWRGLHRSNFTVLINLAFVKESSSIVGVILHELAHNKSSFHDRAHGSEMQDLFATLLASLLPF